ncbi:MAG: saccharopine dehydrogenase [Deltaproteobacteria bacterium]|nr:saccharopine dehydrogenase [Deltaproteobacteria bacterium]MBT7710365.1 saccharopine dehydrogenase [Deltaproteobacteria bacterium]
MKKIAVLGAGFVTKPAVDYFIDRCGYEVIVTSLKKSEAEKIVQGRPSGKAIAWTIDQSDALDRLVSEVDLVMSMIPPSMHIPVAAACLKHHKNLVTTSYISPDMESLSQACQQNGILFLNEIGEDPGLDIMSSKKLIDEIKMQKGEVTAVTSYGAGLPAFEHNNNPFGYKFSWSPRGIILAAQSSAAYLKKGQRVEIPARDLFDHHWLIDLDDIGSFETYPNRDCQTYLDCFGLEKEVSFYRGLLRYTGWCNTMKGLVDLNLFDITAEKDYAGTTYAQFMASLIKEQNPENILQKTARFLKTKENSDLIKRLKWLGLFEDKEIAVSKGTNGDVLIKLMTGKMSYRPLEQDMVIIHNEVLADFTDHKEKRISTLLVKGEPAGDSAMSRAVSLPAAIASRLILEGKLKAKGVQRPTLQEIYQPVLEEMCELGFRFKQKTMPMDTLQHNSNAN